PLYARPPLRDPDRRPDAQEGAHHPQGRDALPHQPAARLRLQSALPARLRPLPRGAAGARARRANPGRLPCRHGGRGRARPPCAGGLSFPLIRENPMNADCAVIFDVDGVLLDLTRPEEDAFFAPFERLYGLTGLSRDWDSY